MAQSVDLYDTAYGNFATEVLEQVRRETYGEDFGQSSSVTGQEYRRFFRLLGLAAAEHVLDDRTASRQTPPRRQPQNRTAQNNLGATHRAGMTRPNLPASRRTNSKGRQALLRRTLSTQLRRALQCRTRRVPFGARSP